MAIEHRLGHENYFTIALANLPESLDYLYLSVFSFSNVKRETVAYAIESFKSRRKLSKLCLYECSVWSLTAFLNYPFATRELFISGAHCQLSLFQKAKIEYDSITFDYYFKYNQSFYLESFQNIRETLKIMSQKAKVNMSISTAYSFSLNFEEERELSIMLEKSGGRFKVQRPIE